MQCRLYSARYLPHLHIITNKYRRLLDILFYWTGATIKSQEINRHAKLCIKFWKSAKPPIFFYKMSDRVHSIVNPLCVFDHLVSDHHILVLENRFRKKLRCRVWFHFTTENSISFEDVWPEGIIFDSLVENAGASLIDEEMDTTPSEHFFNFFIHVSFRARIYVLISGIFRPLFTSFIVVFLAVLSCFPFLTNWKHFLKIFHKVIRGVRQQNPQMDQFWQNQWLQYSNSS